MLSSNCKTLIDVSIHLATESWILILLKNKEHAMVALQPNTNIHIFVCMYTCSQETVLGNTEHYGA